MKIEKARAGTQERHAAKLWLRSERQMKKLIIGAALILFPTFCLSADETMLLELVELTVDNTAAQRQYAVFRSNEQLSRTITIPLWFPFNHKGKNEKNIKILISQFPCSKPERNAHGRKCVPTGKLAFRVPRESPEEKISEWELAQFYIRLKTEK